MRASLLTALAVGRGTGCSFSMTVTGGHRPKLYLSADGGRSTRWMDRVLVRQYESGEWRSVARRPPRPARAWCARRLVLPGELRRAEGEPDRILPAIVAGVSSPVPNVEFVLSVRGVPHPPGLRWPGGIASERRSSAPGTAAPRRRPTAGVVEPADIRPRDTAFWAAEAHLAGHDHAEMRALVGAVEAAWNPLDGVGLRFRPGHPSRPAGGRLLLGERELAALLPTWECGLPAPDLSSSLVRRVSVGRDAWGAPLALPIAPDEGWHAAVLGETGMGKSSLLASLATRFARFGTVVVLDPLGETASVLGDELGGTGAPVRRIVAGPGGRGLNALEGVSELSAGDASVAERRLNDLVEGLRRVREGRFPAQPFWGPRLEEMLGRAVRAAAAIPGGTLEDAHGLLARIRESARGLSGAAELLTRELRHRVDDRPEDAEGARRVLYEVARNPTLRAMLCCREPAFAASELVRDRQVVLVSGAASEVGEVTAAYVVAVYLALLWSALVERRHAGKTFVILDEAQLFAHGSLIEMLRLGRRYNVHAILATQSLRSLADDVREAVRTNVAHLVAFRGSPDDARDLSRSFAGVRPDELMALPRGSALALVGKGELVRRVRTARLLPRPGPRRPPPVALASSAAPGARVGSGATEGIPPPRRASLPGATRGVAAGWHQRLLAVVRSQPSEALVRVPSRELTGPDGVDERLLRSVGGFLGRTGALVRTERSDDGLVWWVDPARLGAPEVPTRTPVASAAPGASLEREDRFLS